MSMHHLEEPGRASIASSLTDHRFSRRGFVRLTALAAGAASFGTLLAACADDDDDTDDGADAPAVDPDEDDDEDEPDTEPDDEDDDADDGEPAAPAGGELVIANEQSPVSLDPQFVRDVGSTRAMGYMYDSLIETDHATELAPALATSWDVTNDGLTYTFDLHEGVVFHDGEPFNAEAARINFERHWDESLNTLYVDDFNRYLGAVEVIDEFTLEHRLDELFARWLHDFVVGSPGLMSSPAAIEALGADLHTAPVGCGPFKYVEFERDSHLVMERFDDYWRGTPALDRIRVRIIPEQGVQMVELEAGSVDISFSVQARDVSRLESAGVDVVSQPALTAVFIAMNVNKGHMQELPVRQAAALSMDRDAIISELMLGFGQHSRGGAAEGWPRYHDDIPMDTYDPEEAGRILDEAGWVMGSDGVRERNGEQLHANVLSTQLERQLSYGLMNEILQQSLEAIGFSTDIQVMEWGAYLDEFRAGEWWEISFHAQNATFTDAVGAQIGPDMFWNVNQLGKVPDDHELKPIQEEVRELYNTLDQTVDADERIAVWKEIQLLAEEHKLLSWLPHWNQLVGYQPRVQNLQVKPSLQFTIYRIDQVSVGG